MTYTTVLSGRGQKQLSARPFVTFGKLKAPRLHNIWLTLFPFLSWHKELTRATLRDDVIAGLSGAMLVMPQGVAFAAIAGMPPEYGLYAAMVPTIIAALYGSSRHLVSGPTTAASIVLFTSLSALAEPGSIKFVQLAITLTFMVGIIELALGVARLGILVNFISDAVIVGFTAGAALLIAIHQLKNFFGISVPNSLNFHELLLYLYYNISQLNVLELLVGFITFGTGVFFKKRYPRVPNMLIALAGGTLIAALLNWFFFLRAGAPPGIALVGKVPASLPPLSSPDLSMDSLKTLAPVAMAMALFSLAASVSVARSLAGRSGQLIQSNQEFVGQGLSNIFGSFFSAYVSTGSINRSALNYSSGAQTPFAAVFSGVVLLAAVIAIVPVLAQIPLAGMAAALFQVAWGLVDVKSMRRIYRASRGDTFVMGVTFVSTMLLDLEFAILLGVLISLIFYLRNASQPRVQVRTPNSKLPNRPFTTDASLATCPQLAIVSIEGTLFFGSAHYVAERLRLVFKKNPEQKHLLLLARGISSMDVAGARMLAEHSAVRRRVGGDIYFHELRGQALEIASRFGVLDSDPEGHVFQSKREAIANIFPRLDKTVCERCEKRIFREC
jgi:SulP family sulfate permease